MAVNHKGLAGACQAQNPNEEKKVFLMVVQNRA